MERVIPDGDRQSTAESAQRCLAELYENSYDRMVRLTATLYVPRPPHVSSEDLVQEAYLRIFIRAGSGEVSFETPVHAQQYWRTSIENLFNDVTTRERKHPSVSLDETDQDGLPLIQIPDHAVNVQDEVDGVERDANIKLLVRKLIAGLPLEQREVFERRLEGLEYKAIAAELYITAGAARIRFLRGRKKIREVLETMGIKLEDF